MIDWKDIHPDFRGYWGEEKKEKWQEVGFDDTQQVKEWIESGLKVSQSEIAAYAKWKGYQPSSINAAELRKEYYQAQNWLDYYYPLMGETKLKPNEGKKRSEIKSLNVDDRNLEGSLILEGFINLEKFYCCDNQLIGLKLIACPNLKVLKCSGNKLTRLDLVGLSELTELDCSDNQITNLKLNNLSNLSTLDCCNNLLTSVEFLTQLPQPQKLEELYINGNDFVSQELTFLTPLVNLKKLFLEANSQKSQFSGTLQPLQNLTKLEKLDISNNGLKGFLNLRNFTNLENFSCFNNKLTRLDISECPQLKEFNCYGNQLTNLDISKNFQLAKLVCSENQLTKLEIGKNVQLTDLICWSNLLTELDLSSLTPEKLKRLDISNNNFSEQDLSLFSKFVNLKYLVTGTYDKEKIQQNIYNRFIGTLKPLKDMNKLEELDISNTDINQGVECLPNNIIEIYYSTEERSESKLEEISWQLKLFESKNQKNWEKLGFSLEEIKTWIKFGLEANDYNFADYLKRRKNLTPQELAFSQQIDELRREYKENEDQQFQGQVQADHWFNY